MVQALLLSAMLSAGPAAAPPAESLRRELDGVAVEIAELKARAMDGEDVRAELQPLLVRSQELAEALERHAPRISPAAAPSPSATVEDLRGRADALYQEADAVAGELVEVEARISAALDAGARRVHAAAGPARLSAAALQVDLPAQCASTAAAPSPPAIPPLLELRARIKQRVRHLLAEAAELDDAADRLER